MIEAKHNRKDAIEMPALGLKLTDIYYVLFRQKWIILGCLAAGLLAGGAVLIAGGVVLLAVPGGTRPADEVVYKTVSGSAAQP